MPLPIIADVVRFACTGTGGSGEPFANIIHCKHTGGAPTSSDITAASNVLAKIYNGTPTLTASGGWFALMKNTSAFSKITATVLDGISASVTTTYSYLGSANQDSLPPGVALVASLHTANRGRSYRGRVFLPAPVEGYSDGVGHFDSGQATAQAGVWTAAIAALAAINWTLVVASYKLASATAVSSVIMDTVFDSQRRRKR